MVSEYVAAKRERKTWAKLNERLVKLATRLEGHGSKWARRKEAAIAALLECPTVKEAAKKCGLSYSTLKRWLRGPLKQAFEDASKLVLQTTIDRHVERFAEPEPRKKGKPRGRPFPKKAAAAALGADGQTG
jgi:hypothetical protein